MSERHKPGAFKQTNKAHNTGKHKSKGEAAKINKGKIDVKVLTRKKQRLLNRQAKNNQKEQLKKEKRFQVIEEKRKRGVKGSPPFLVSVLPSNSEHSETKSHIENLLLACQQNDILNVASQQRSLFVDCHRFKQRFEFVFPNSVIGHLDSNKVSDCLLIYVTIDDLNQSGVSDDDEVKADWLLNHQAICNLDNIYNQGLSSVAICCKGLTTFPLKKQSEAKKFIASLFEKKFTDLKVHVLDTLQDMVLLLRSIAAQKLKKVMYREMRSHMFASEVSYEPYSASDDKGILKLSGYLRGAYMTANQLVHIPSYGNFQVHRITTRQQARRSKDAMEQDEKEVVLSKPNGEDRVGLECYVEKDEDEDDDEGGGGNDADEEMLDGAMKVTKKLVPKGLSKYQASWLDDEEDEEEEEDDDDDFMELEEVGEEGKEDMGSEEKEEEEEEEEEERVEMETATEKEDDKYDDKYDEHEEANSLKRYKEARLNEMFPDEIDTPGDVSARIRFKKYKGMKSFRTSPLDPFVDLPEHYSKIVRFNKFDEVRRRLMKKILKTNRQEEDEEEDEDEAKKVRSGPYVTLHLENVSDNIQELINSKEPIVAFALLPFEQNISVVHLLIRRCPGDNTPIKSKQPMIFHMGCHRFNARPIYSQNSAGDRHKFERFFTPSSTMVASIYAPLTFPPSTVLMFQPDSHGEKLVGTGSLFSVNPDRMIIKRCILSGHPFKIHTNSAVIRYMFFNPNDVRWFSPIELRTKYGRKGRIVEPVGTHGHMKCKFNKQLTSQDTVLMSLYKRVFPKWIDYTLIKT